MYFLSNNKIVDDVTGEIVVSDLKPRFSDLKYEDYYKEFKETKEIRFLEPMTAKEIKKGEEIPSKGFIAEEKFDGHRSLCYDTRKGNRFFSRRISKKSRWYSENTDQLPHLRDILASKKLIGTVLDGELTMNEFSEVQGVTGALPETAILNQGEKGFAVYNVFDILYYKGINVQHMPLWKRKLFLWKVVCEINNPYIKFAKIYVTKETQVILQRILSKYNKMTPFPYTVGDSYKDLLIKVWERGGEGLMIKDIYAKYEQKRSKNFLKLKDCIYRDVVIMGYEEPTKYFEGKSEYWNYWECYDDPDGVTVKEMKVETASEYTPLTKPYAMGWVGAIIGGVYKDGKLVEVVKAKGISDENQEFIRQNRKDLIGRVIEVRAQMISDPKTGTLRHPRFNRFRLDKSAEMCTWEDHIL